MSILNFILITVVLAGDLFATAYHSSEPHETKTSCGPVLKPCACVTKNPCEIDYPAEIRRHALTAQDIRNYILTQSPEKLDLSWQNIKNLDKNAFDSCTDLTSLDLSHNEISKLPEYIFANLTNLEHLSLAGNNIKGTKNVFAGLNNLKTLDISGNPLTEILDDNCFFGLTNSCEITMRGVIGVKKIGTNAFGVQYSTSVQDTIDNDETKPKSIHARNAPVYPTSYSINENKIFDNFHAQICIEGDSVVRLDILKASENVTTGCKEISTKWKTYDLSKMGLSKFEKGWYRLNDKTQVPAQVSVMRLTNNNIVRVTSNIMNELSDYITWMDIAHNKIERLEEGCFEHKHIFSLLLNNNLISEIENNAFKMPALYQLYLEGNRLKDTKFAATLPSSLVSLNLDGNEITEISANSFSNLKSLSYLNLSKNKLTVLPNHCLRGATSINQLLISDNQITTVESRAFEDLRPFQIFLGGNKISSFEQGTFTEIVSLQQINVVRNKLTKIESTMFDQPNLRLLQLGGNNITLIEKGAVKNLKKLEKLDISKNPITRLENGALAGLNKMGKVYVDVTKTPIEVIQGGLFDDV